MTWEDVPYRQKQIRWENQFDNVFALCQAWEVAETFSTGGLWRDIDLSVFFHLCTSEHIKSGKYVPRLFFVFAGSHISRTFCLVHQFDLARCALVLVFARLMATHPKMIEHACWNHVACLNQVSSTSKTPTKACQQRNSTEHRWTGIFYDFCCFCSIISWGNSVKGISPESDRQQRSCFPDQSWNASLHHPGLPRSLAARVGRLSEGVNDTGFVSDDENDATCWKICGQVEVWSCFMSAESVRLEHLRYMVLDEAGALIKLSMASYAM